MSELCKQHAGGDTTVAKSCERVVYTPRFDIAETEDDLLLYGDLPGVESSALDIRFEERELIVHGKVSPRHADEQHIRSEYGIGDFHRTFSVSESIDGDGISAELKNGVLTVRLPKSAASKPKRIEVKAV
jgi:HSP20 family protein